MLSAKVRIWRSSLLVFAFALLSSCFAVSDHAYGDHLPKKGHSISPNTNSVAELIEPQSKAALKPVARDTDRLPKVLATLLLAFNQIKHAPSNFKLADGLARSRPTKSLSRESALNASALNAPQQIDQLRIPQKPVMLAPDEQKALDEQSKWWEFREDISRKGFRAVVGERESNRKQKEEKKIKREADPEGGDKDATRIAFVASTAAVVVAALVLRLGGRAALVGILGLDMISEMGINDGLDQLIAFANESGDWKIVLFLAGWIVAKCTLFDGLSILLALSSGILFGGVIQGALISTAGASLGSLVAFYLSKTFLQERAKGFIEDKPVARALQKVVEKDGFKTVLVLRLSPVLPGVPLGAYNYIYGLSKLNPLTFVSATALGSLKPYLLDSYVGVLSKQLLDGDLDSSKDTIVVVGLGILVLVGVFATQVANDTFEIVQEEVAKDEKKKKEQATEQEVVPEASGPLTGVKKWASGLVPEDIRTENAEVWRTLEKFLEDQWVPSVQAELDALDALNAETEKLEEARKEDKLWEFLTTYEEPERKENNDYTTPELLAERQRLAVWSREGAQPLRRVLTSLSFSFALISALRKKWKDYPEAQEELDKLRSGVVQLVTAAPKGAAADLSPLQNGPSSPGRLQEVEDRLAEINRQLEATGSKADGPQIPRQDASDLTVKGEVLRYQQELDVKIASAEQELKETLTQINKRLESRNSSGDESV